MNIFKTPLLSNENCVHLLESSVQAILFNIIVASLLSLILTFQKVPINSIAFWFIGIVLVSLARFVFCKNALKRKSYLSNTNFTIFIFLILTLITGCLWSLVYILFIPYLTTIREAIVILVLGGLCAGAVLSLSAYLPAYCAYVLPMFLPVIIYNYSLMNAERSILATMFLLFVSMILILAKINNRLLDRVFQLNVQKDSLINQLINSNKKLEAYNEEIHTLSITDSLTGLFNRRYFDIALLNELNRSRRNQYPLSLILIDLDNFKYINDTFGHPYGDKYLRFTADTLRNSVRRSNEIIIRIGGDEFAIIAANMDLDQTKILCKAIGNEFDKNNRHHQVTLSIGVTCISPENKIDLDTIITTADKMLYRAKDLGKNKMEIITV